MFRHKHPAFKALRDTVAFVVLCAALEWYVSHTDGAEAAAAFRTVWPTLAVYCAGGALLVSVQGPQPFRCVCPPSSVPWAWPCR